MSKRQSFFGLGTGIGVALLGATLGPIDPAGWHLLVVGVGIGAITIVSELLQARSQAAAIPANSIAITQAH